MTIASSTRSSRCRRDSSSQRRIASATGIGPCQRVMRERLAITCGRAARSPAASACHERALEQAAQPDAPVPRASCRQAVELPRLAARPALVAELGERLDRLLGDRPQLVRGRRSGSPRASSPRTLDARARREASSPSAVARSYSLVADRRLSPRAARPRRGRSRSRASARAFAGCRAASERGGAAEQVGGRVVRRRGRRRAGRRRRGGRPRARRARGPRRRRGPSSVR